MDDLLDLNWSSTPSGSTSANGSKPISPNPPPAKPAVNSQFDFLAKSNTGGTSGTSSPNYYNASTTPRSFTPSSQAPKPPVVQANAPRAPAAPPKGASDDNDAFSSLLGVGTSGAGGSKHMTLAQRQAQMAEEKKRKEEHERQQFAGLGNWDQPAARAGVASASTSSNHRTASPLQPVPTKTASSFDALLQPVSRPSSSASRSTPNPPTLPVKSAKAGWEDDDFMVGTSLQIGTGQSGQPGHSPQPDDPWDFDQLAAVKPKPTSGITGNGGSSRGGQSGMRIPDPNFDFGEWRDQDEEEQGILSSSRASPDYARRRDDERIPARPVRSTRAASPPPHIIGQIVEMGFSPAQARQALAKTSNGLDVQAALDTLLAEAFSTKGGESGDDLGAADDDYVERERIRCEEEDRERRRRRRQGPSRETVKPRSGADRESDRSGTGTPIHADQILAQASEIGQSVFTRATSLWNTGKERAMKALEEQRKAYEAQQAEARKGKTSDGRPRWMVEAEEREHDGRQDDAPASTGFRDDDDDVHGHAPSGPARPPKPSARSNGTGEGSSRRQREEPPVERYMSTTERADLLFAEEPRKYVSPARHRKPAAEAGGTVARTATPPAPLPARTLVPADPGAVQMSASHKTKGNDHFKLGRFTEAESAYSAGISRLPTGHLYLIPLYNNRAATRLKLGDSNGAAEDSTAVITIIGPSYHPSKEAPLPADVAAEVKLADSLVKAMTKRAQAWEMGEKWSKAVEDWERVLGFDAAILGGNAATTRNLGAEGLRRSKRMLEGGESKPPVSAKPAAKRPTRAATPSNVNDSEAVATLRAAAKALEAEDQQRLQLKDSVEARLNAWKGGKETNLRALLASLDTILWDEVLAGGLKVGMHELIAEKQVKIKYMKVIARLHPDKLDVNKTTVEQRMLANGAFGTLNEAWQAFNNA